MLSKKTISIGEILSLKTRVLLEERGLSGYGRGKPLPFNSCGFV